MNLEKDPARALLGLIVGPTPCKATYTVSLLQDLAGVVSTNLMAPQHGA